MDRWYDNNSFIFGHKAAILTAYLTTVDPSTPPSIDRCNYYSPRRYSHWPANNGNAVRPSTSSTIHTLGAGDRIRVRNNSHHKNRSTDCHKNRLHIFLPYFPMLGDNTRKGILRTLSHFKAFASCPN